MSYLCPQLSPFGIWTPTSFQDWQAGEALGRLFHEGICIGDLAFLAERERWN